MSKDIASILSGWDFDPDEFQVRIIAGDDGREKIQMRLDLGLLQLELEGRPDGARPLGAESLLDHFEATASEGAPRLDRADCERLMREGTQYYHRYLALYHLARYDLVVRDAERNLRLFRFVVEHAERDEDKLAFDRFRPYVLMMRARARGQAALDSGDTSKALEAIDEGIAGALDFLADHGESDNEAQCRELQFLRRWRSEVERDRKRGPVERLEEQLALAVRREQYEEAARLRDQIRRFRLADRGRAPARPEPEPEPEPEP